MFRFVNERRISKRDPYIFPENMCGNRFRKTFRRNRLMRKRHKSIIIRHYLCTELHHFWIINTNHMMSIIFEKILNKKILNVS